MYRIRQEFAREHLTDVRAALREQLAGAGVEIAQGAKIAITVGSRGITNLSLIVKGIVDWVKERGGEPFIVPAMGSHGGATAEGQRLLLAGYGITEAMVGAPVRSSMEVVELPRGDLDNRVFMDRLAYEADGTILFNRIKPHTDFHGPVESGLMKMAVIGLGKHRQALEIHRFGVEGLKKRIVPTARQILRFGKILLGVGLVENAYNEIAMIEALKPEAIEAGERRLLAIAREMMPRLPASSFDLLIVDEMGKDISGVGMDPNIIGRVKIQGEPEPDSPRITSIVALDLTEGSHGNAIGMGLADVVPRGFMDKIDFEATFANVVTSTFFERGKLPVVAGDIQEAILAGLRACGPIEPERAGIVRIKNTLRLEEVFVSAALWDEIKDRPELTALGEPEGLMDESGRLAAF